MKSKLLIALFLTLNVLAHGAYAADAALLVDSDLIITPDQMAKFFTYEASQFQTTSTLSWPNLQFTQPYVTSWSNVQAQGPFSLQFDTTHLATNEIDFTINWANPQVSVGTFSINDTVTETVSGINLVVHLNGTCTGMTINVPNGNWVMKGAVHWDYQTQAFVLSWINFGFQMNTAATPILNLGQCNGPQGLNDQLLLSLSSTLQNQASLQSLMQQGIMGWMQTKVASLQTQLLTSRASALNSTLNAAWIPNQISALPGGLLRVAGDLSLSKVGSTVGAATVARNYNPSILSAVTQTGLITPKNTFQSVLAYLFANGSLMDPVSSTSISTFQSFMSNRFEQFFVWPDLMSFPTNTDFTFDITSSSAPTVGAGYILDGGGSIYNVSAPLLVHQLAPYRSQMLPYIDFSSPFSGTVSAVVSAGNLKVNLAATANLNVSAYFRPEFARTRSENTWIANSILSSEVQSYLNSAAYSFALPTWSVIPGLNLQISDVQVYTQSLRIPLVLQPSP